MTIYISLPGLLAIAETTLASRPLVRDIGLLAAAVERPKTTVFGEDAYPNLLTKAAALMHSIIASHPLVDGNKRVGLTAAAMFLEINGVHLELPEDDAYEFVLSIARGELSEVDKIAEGLRRFTP